MIRDLTCIECPEGCRLSTRIEQDKVIAVTGNKCPKGEKYAISEIENPVRVLTSTVLTEALDLKMVPVRTDGPIPKSDLFKAMKEVKKMRIKKPLKTGDIIQENFISPGVNLISTRDCA